MSSFSVCVEQRNSVSDTLLLYMGTRLVLPAKLSCSIPALATAMLSPKYYAEWVHACMPLGFKFDDKGPKL